MENMRYTRPVYMCKRLKESDPQRKCRFCGRVLSEYTRYVENKLTVIGYGLDGDGLFCSAQCGSSWVTKNLLDPRKR